VPKFLSDVGVVGANANVGARVDAGLGFRHGTSTSPSWTTGTGSPEGAVAAPVGSLFSRTDGGTNTAIYRKESGAGNTGWIATGAAVGGVTSVDGRTGVVALSDLYVDVAGDNITGNLGLGAPSPTAKLHLAADTVASGGVLFGADTNLYRSAPSTLTSDGLVQAVGVRSSTQRPLGQASGADLVTNGAFTTDFSGWTNGGNWVWSAGTASHVVGAVSALTQTLSGLTVGLTYEVITTIVGRTAGSVTVWFSAQPSNAQGVTATKYLVALAASQDLIIVPTTDFNGAVDSITVRPISRSAPQALFDTTPGNLVSEVRAVGTNIAIGLNALPAPLGSATGCVAIGNEALRSTVTTTGNTAIGCQAMSNSPTGGASTAVGYQALNGLGAGNGTAVGYQAGKSLTTGVNNTIVGSSGLTTATTAAYNVAIGAAAMMSTTTANYSSALGASALSSTTTGSSNVGVGYWAGSNPNGVQANATKTASRQVLVGQETGQSSPTQVDDAIAVGYRALIGGASAIAVGSGASANAAGSVAIGRDSTGTSATTSTTDDFVLGTINHTVKIPGALDMGQRQIMNVVTHKLATAPASPVEGQRYYDTGLKLERYWDGTKWSDQTDIWVGPDAPTGTPALGDEWYDTDDVSGLVFPVSVAQGGTGGTSPTMARSSLSVPYVGNSSSTAGPPTTGTYVRGDHWLDSSNVLWICTVAGSPGTWISVSSGEELAYNQITSSVTLSSNTVASPNLVIEGTTRTYDGSLVMIEVSAILGCGTPTGSAGFLNLWDGSTDLGVICEAYNGASTVNFAVNVSGRRRLIPTAGSHNYRVTGWCNTGTGNVYTSAGGAGLNQFPAFIRVTRA